MPEVEARNPLVFPDAVPGRPVYLARTQARYESPNVVIGEIQSGLFCSRKGDFTWAPQLYTQMAANNALFGIFRSELGQAHYPLPRAQAKDDIFNLQKTPTPDPSVSRNQLQVGVLVKSAVLNACEKSGTQWSGEAAVRLFWQVLAPEQKKVIFEATTEGVFRTTSRTPDTVASPGALLQAAFRAATRNFLAEPGFLNVVSTPADAALLAADVPAAAASAGSGAAVPREKIRIDAVSSAALPLTAKITDVRAAVVTVTTGFGSGSGFFISGSGYLLTNHHVVRDASFVKVKLTTGRELLGDVVRVDADRDVALIKTEASVPTPLPIRADDPAIGEEVFAVGSPLGETFNASLTKGILSGYRELAGNSFLQSDVAILPGNSGGPLLDSNGRVLGITAMGLGAKGLAGLNFFIPIRDALLKLDVQVQSGDSQAAVQHR